MPVDYDRIREENLIEYGQGDRHLAFLGRLYTDRTHFIFELVQNAEDAGATELTFTLHSDRLEVRHNGRAFTEADVRGICGIDESTKTEDLTKIGKFGIGFKSVYAFTRRPEIHSDDEHFCIERYVRPHAAPAKPVALGETLFVLPFDHAELAPALACSEIGEALKNLDLNTMLFLRSIGRVNLSGDGIADAALERTATQRSDRCDHVVLTETADEVETSQWYVWSRNVAIDGAAGLRVQVAFAVAPDGSSVMRLNESPLVVFFPTEKETYLGFLAQAPYRTTPARDNIPHHDDWNQRLVEETGQLLRTALVDLRDSGLLDVEVLNALPLDQARFQAGSMFRPIYDVALETLRTEALVPTTDGDHGLAAEVRLARGGGLRDLLSGEQFGQLFGTDARLRWVSESITEGRTPQLWRYLRDELKVEEVTPESVITRLSEEFLAPQTDEWMIRFYAFLNANAALWRSQGRYGVLPPARGKPIIRLEDGSHVRPFDGQGLPLAYLPSGLTSEFPTVRAALASEKTVREFLTALGLVEPDVTAEVLEVVLPRYAGSDPEALDWDQHQEDLDRIARALKEVSSDRADQLRSKLRSATFVRARNLASGESQMKAPAGLYRTSAHIEAYFEANSAAWVVGREYEPWTQLLRDVGVSDHPKITSRRPDRLKYVEIASSHGWHERGVDGFDPDARIEELEFALSQPKLERSRYVWNELLAPFHHLVAGTVETSTRQGFDHATRTERRSVLGEIAATSDWLPSPEGRWVRPEHLSLDALPADFKRDEALAKALGMSLPAVEEAARELDVSPDLLRHLRDPDVRDALERIVTSRSAEAADGLSVEDGEDAEDDSDAPPEIDYAVALAEAFDRPARARPSTDGPRGGGHISNPDLRRQRTRDAIADDQAAEPQPQDRFRPVPRKVWEAKDSATRHFVEEQYSGRCQICEETFHKRDGRPYFEALYLVARTKARWIDRPGNVLCLCANCCAKLQHGPVEADDLMEQILTWQPEADGGDGSANLCMNVCGEDVVITFTEKHLLDLQEMVAVDA